MPCLAAKVARYLGARVACEHLRGREVAGTKNAAHDGFAHGAAADYTQGLAVFEESHTRITTRSAVKVKSLSA
jgi:hypothetical protein